MRRVTGGVIVVLVVLGITSSLDAYLKLGTRLDDGRVVGVKWTQPIRYFVTGRDVPGVSAGDLQLAVQRAFQTWLGVEHVEFSLEFAGFTGAEPGTNDDGMSVIGFQSRPDLERTLGAASFEVNTTTGFLVASDIFLNANFAWSVAGGGQADRFDVESISLHETGHFLGLGHSALGETELQPNGRRRVLGKRAVMFPIAFGPGTILDRTLRDDDRAGLIDIYSNTGSNRALGSISGKVTLNGTGIFGAHVMAFNPSTGHIVASYSLGDQGEFVISSLEPGLYVVRAEPLDDADVDSIFNTDRTVNIDFKPGFHPSLVSVPAGGASSGIDVRVQSK